MRVYVLGAGASLHAGYPLMKDLGHELAAWAASLPESDINAAFALAHGKLTEWQGSNRLDNLEQLVTEADAGAFEIENWQSIRAGIGILLAQFLSPRPGRPATAYAALARLLADGDVVATFNYDISLELELAGEGKWQIHSGYGFEISPSGPGSPVVVLKLHGSANWRATVLGGRTGVFQSDGPVADPRPTFSPSACRQLGFPDFADPDFVCGGAVNYMILPSFDKRFYWETSLGEEGRLFWDLIWKQTEDAIKRCDEVILIGYSLPAADLRGRNLLLHSIPASTPVTVCSGGDSERIASEFRAIGCRNVETVEHSFESWISGGAVATQR